MRIATLSIGDELLYGEVVDGNAAHIGQRLYRRGLKVGRHLTVGDHEGDIVEALRVLAADSDALIVTGGLGPTCDDLTAGAAAKATGCRLVLNEEALAHLGKMAGKLGGGIHPVNERQALIPERSTLIPNPVGTACGFELSHNGCVLFFMPGVPVEMARMLEETVIPSLVERRLEKHYLATKVLKVFGISEAEVEARLQGMMVPGVMLAFGLDFPEIHVKLRAQGEDGAAVAEMLKQAGEQVRQRIGRYIFGEDDDTMDSVVAELLRRKQVTLSLAESCTGGMVAQRVTSVSGSSAYFLEGVVTYADGAKARILGVPTGLLAEKGAVSAETALAMAEGARRNSGSDVAVAVTGIAGPGGGSKEKPVGTVFLALSSSVGCEVKEYHFSGNREEIRMITTFTALDWLRHNLLSA